MQDRGPTLQAGKDRKLLAVLTVVCTAPMLYLEMWHWSSGEESGQVIKLAVTHKEVKECYKGSGTVGFKIHFFAPYLS